MGVTTVLVVLCGSVGALTVDTADKEWERPIAKVVKMLKDMTATLQKEADTDAEMYAEMACWCETGGKSKELAIKTGEQRVKDLGAAIEEYSAKSEQLTADIETLTADVEEKETALQEATGIRDKELAEFNAEEKDMIQSITSLKGAVTVMSKAHGESALLQVKDLLRHQSKKYRRVLGESLSDKQRHAVMSLIQERSSSLSLSRTPASGEIFGILKQMKESFETNMATSKKEEEQAASDFAQMKAAKTKEIAAANDQIESKKVQLGDTEEKYALSVTDKKDTEKALAADIEFLADLQSKCATADAEYQARVKVRTEEMKAVSETVGMLTSEEANDAFTKSMSFIQVKRVSGSRKKASDLLKSVGQKFKNPRLVTLSVKMRLDAFAEVKKEIDLMVAELKKTQADEVADRDYCIKSLNENTKQAAAANDAKSDLDTKIADLTASIAELTEAITALKTEVTNTQVEMKKANAIREAENKDFSMTISDQRATQAILEKALDRLKAFYEKKALLQEDQAPGEALAPPPAQATYKPSAGGGGVMAMIQGVIDESKTAENDAIADETSAQAAYEGFIKDSNKLINANNEDIASKSEAKAKADMEKATADGDLKETVETILTLDDTSKTLHDQCDFLLKNFEERQSSRTQEIDALNQAKAIFSGMKF